MNVILKRLWSIVCAMAKAVYLTRRSWAISPVELFGHQFLLHAALDTGCPLSFVRTVLRLFPDQVRDWDPASQLPLSVLAAAPISDISIVSRLMEDILRIFPQAAETPDADGMYPLHLAARSGKEWDCGLRSIFMAAPFIGNCEDVCSGMFPFMMAASQPRKSSQHHSRCTKGIGNGRTWVGSSRNQHPHRRRSDSFDNYETFLSDILLGDPDRWAMRFWDEDVSESNSEDEEGNDSASSERQRDLSLKHRTHPLPASVTGATELEADTASLDAVYNLLLCNPTPLRHYNSEARWVHLFCCSIGKNIMCLYVHRFMRHRSHL